MDPLTVLKIASVAASTAKAAWDVGEGIYTFCSDVKVVNQTISGLVAEVKALGSACTLVDERLRDIVKEFENEVRRPVADRRELWNCVELQIRESQLSVGQLEAALIGIKDEGSNTFSQAWRQIKLNMKARDIGEARNRIRSHTASLQTILQTVAIEICYVVPQRADQHLQLLLSGMNECLEQLKAIREERDEPYAEDNQHAIIRVSEEVASEGESLYAASIASGSVWGDTSQTSTNIRDWMKDIRAIDDVVSRTSLLDEEVTSSYSFSDGTTAREGCSDLADAAEQADPDQNQAAETDSDDDLLIEVAKQALDAGRTTFAAKEYPEAASYLRESLKLVRELPANQQRICDTFELRWMLSVCSYHTQPPQEAEADLLSVLELSSRTHTKTDKHLAQMCDAGHMIAQVYVKLDKLEQARLYCENALRGRRRLLGKDSAETCQSIALMARILRLQGNEYRAKLYMRLISEAETKVADDPFHDLSPTVDHSPGHEDKTVRLQPPLRLAPSPPTIVARPDSPIKEYHNHHQTPADSGSRVQAQQDFEIQRRDPFDEAVDFDTDLGTISIAMKRPLGAAFKGYEFWSPSKGWSDLLATIKRGDLEHASVITNRARMFSSGSVEIRRFVDDDNATIRFPMNKPRVALLCTRTGAPVEATVIKGLRLLCNLDTGMAKWKSQSAHVTLAKASVRLLEDHERRGLR